METRFIHVSGLVSCHPRNYFYSQYYRYYWDIVAQNIRVYPYIRMVPTNIQMLQSKPFVIKFVLVLQAFYSLNDKDLVVKITKLFKFICPLLLG